MMSDSELEKLRTQLYWQEEHGQAREALKILHSIQLDALRHAREVVEKHDIIVNELGEDNPEANPALPDLDRLIQELSLR